MGAYGAGVVGSEVWCPVKVAVTVPLTATHQRRELPPGAQGPIAPRISGR